MSNPAMRPLTVHDYRELPEGGPRYQLIDGDLEMTPAPNLYHQTISRNLEMILAYYLEENPIGEVFDAPVDVYLTDTNVFQPDILFVAKENAVLLKDDGIHGAPDIVVEILSPTSIKHDLGSKKRVYTRCGVLEYWVIDPDAKRLSVYNLRMSPDEPTATWREKDTFETPFLPGLRIDLARVFRKRIGG